MRRTIAVTAALVLAATALRAAGEGDPPADRPAFSAAEQPARVPATCATLASTLEGVPEPQARIDLAVVGALTLVQTDGALWYLAVCSSPGIRVMCVTYASNGLKPGERVVIRGGYNRQDEDHVVLDPCLASRAPS